MFPVVLMLFVGAVLLTISFFIYAEQKK